MSVAAGAVAVTGSGLLSSPSERVETEGLKPPLSEDIQARRDEMVQELKETHSYDDWVYANCAQNGCRTDTCVLKVLVKDGVMVGVESDPTINPEDAREDIGLDNIRKGRVQSRVCSMGQGYPSQVYHPKRILYPMRNVGGRGPNEARFVRISWDEALDWIEMKCREMLTRYGPYSQFSLMTFLDSLFHVGGYIPPKGLGVSGWGEQSGSGYSAQKVIMTGGRGSNYSMDDCFNSELIILWGRNPTGETQGNHPYYLRLAKEQGIPVICIDPRYTYSAEVLADQYIPIRPGTDMAMILGLAYVMFDEDLYDEEYIEQYVEPVGFRLWRGYVLGHDDGIPKTPEWAEGICGVPAETIAALARLYAQSKPTKMMFGQGPTRSDGWNVTRGLFCLQAMTGNLTVPGGGDPITAFGPRGPSGGPLPYVVWGPAKPYPAPMLLQQQMYHRAILLREEYDNWRMTRKDYNSWIGNFPPQPLPNIQMLIFVSNYINVIWGSNIHAEAVKKVNATWGIGWYTNQPHVQYLDVVLPACINFFEEPQSDPWFRKTRFKSGGGNNNFVIYSEPAIEPLGEVRPHEWFYLEIARRFGVEDTYNPLLADVCRGYWDLDEWNTAMDDIHKEAYEIWASREDMAWRDMPTWEEFKHDPVYRFDAKSGYSFQGDIEGGRNPFRTRDSVDLKLPASGKIEFYSEFLASPEEMRTKRFAYFGIPYFPFGGTLYPTAACLGYVNTDAVKPMPMWSPHLYGTFTDKRVEELPLTMISSITCYRQHTCNDNNPLLRDEVYQHGVWMSVADAKARGIEDGDLVRVYNEDGEMIIPAHVTTRITPGVVDILHSAWYEPSQVETDLMPDGIDRRGACNYLIGDHWENKNDNAACIMTDQVEVEKFDF
jgi:anaerobic dimethyl sulfoxide reductase subunit A